MGDGEDAVMVGDQGEDIVAAGQNAAVPSVCCGDTALQGSFNPPTLTAS